MIRRLVIASSMLSAVASAEEPLSGGQLNAIIAKVREFKPRDQFDSPPAQPSLTGKRFAFVVTPLQRGPDNRICSGFPAWGYRPETTSLEVSPGFGYLPRYDLISKGRPVFAKPTDGRADSTLSINSFACTMTVTATVAANAFNARFPVQQKLEVVNAIAEDRPLARKWTDYWTTSIAGDPARDLIRSLQVRVSGVLSDWSPGVPVKCGVSRREPTISLPVERTADICLIKGAVDRVEFIDARTGEVLATRSPSNERIR